MSMRKRLDLHSADSLLHEQERVRRVVAGNGEALRALVAEYHPLAYGLALKVLGERGDAEEVAQDAFLKIHRALPQFRGDSSLKTWILRIVLRLSLNRRRDRARSAWYRLGLHQGVDGEEAEHLPQLVRQMTPNPESQCISSETRRIVLRLVDELPEALREALILNSFEELSYDEIARVLKVPVGTVSSRIHSARKKLLDKLQRHELL
jgi:RNA polymerase sigma-70 factor (ECF subfamily)